MLPPCPPETEGETNDGGDTSEQGLDAGWGLKEVTGGASGGQPALEGGASAQKACELTPRTGCAAQGAGGQGQTLWERVASGGKLRGPMPRSHEGGVVGPEGAPGARAVQSLTRGR